MAKLLYIKASPMKDRSYSSQAAEAFLKSYTEKNPHDTIETLDLWNSDIPDFDYMASEGKYKIMRGKSHTSEEGEAWKKIVETTDYFKSFDKIVLSTPMWNFSIPYRLKHYIDIIVQPGLTFSFSPDKGYTGLITGKPLQLILARGGVYAEGTEASAFDLQFPYLQSIFGFIGFTDIRSIFVEPTLAGGQEGAEEALKRSLETAKVAGKNF